MQDTICRTLYAGKITIMVARRKPIYNIGMLCAITITVARRKPIYNIGMLCALVRLRLVS